MGRESQEGWKMKVPRLSKKMEKAIEDLAETAQTHGWEKDQGTGRGVDRAEEAYEAALSRLKKLVLRMEQKLKKARERNTYGSVGPTHYSN